MPDRRRVIPFPFGAEAETESPAITLRDLHLTRGASPLLSGVDLELGPRGITALIGPNGAGKSILLRVIAGLVAPDLGRVEIVPELGAPGLVFQRPVLLRRSAIANLTHALSLRGMARRDRTTRAMELLALADLTDKARVPARGLSGGEQQRLALVRALAAAPRLLLLDEPTASLDPAATAAIEALLHRLAGDGVRILIVTHDRAQAARLAGDVVLMHRGRIMETGALSKVFDAPQTEEARAYLDGRLVL